MRAAARIFLSLNVQLERSTFSDPMGVEIVIDYIKQGMLITKIFLVPLSLSNHHVFCAMDADAEQTPAEQAVPSPERSLSRHSTFFS